MNIYEVLPIAASCAAAGYWVARNPIQWPRIEFKKSPILQPDQTVSLAGQLATPNVTGSGPRLSRGSVPLPRPFERPFDPLFDDSVQAFVEEWRAGRLRWPFVPCGTRSLHLAYSTWCAQRGVLKPVSLQVLVRRLVLEFSFSRGHRGISSPRERDKKSTRTRIILNAKSMGVHPPRCAAAAKANFAKVKAGFLAFERSLA